MADSLDFDGFISLLTSGKEKIKRAGETPALRKATALRLGGEIEIALEALFAG